MLPATKNAQKIHHLWLPLGLILMLLVGSTPVTTRAAKPPAPLSVADPSYALAFNGSTNYADFGDTVTLFGGTTWASAKTISVWLNITGNSPSAVQPPAGELVFGTDRPRLFGVTRSTINGADRLWVWNMDAGGLDSFGVPFNRNQWFQLTVVHDGVTLAAYKNGVLAGSVASGPTVVRGGTNAGNFYLGGSGRNDPTLYFQGVLDELVLWNAALDSDDILGWVFRQVDAGHPYISSLAACYTMAAGLGPTLPDDGPRHIGAALMGGMGPASWVASGAFGGASPTSTPIPTNFPPATRTPTPSPTAVPSSTPRPSPTAPPPTPSTIRINSASVALFDRIPPAYKLAAQNIRFLFMDRSVGANINDGLTCLASSSWAASPASCRRDYTDGTLTSYKTFMPNDTNIPATILFPGGYSRANIEFVYGEYTWEDEVHNFVTRFPAYADRDVVTFQHNYLHVDAGSTIDEAYFDPGYAGDNIYDLLALEAQYPDHPFIYWTTSLARTIGTPDAQSFNDQMRLWTLANGKILLDMADIESHAPDGTSCRNAQGYEVICPQYTTETSGGHLGAVSAGKIRIAKAIWVLLARLAGWNP
jgi:hypothetical protein